VLHFQPCFFFPAMSMRVTLLFSFQIGLNLRRPPHLTCACMLTGFISQWTPEQIDNLVALAKANFGEGAERLRRTVRAVYERKKKQRLARTEKDDERLHGEYERSYAKPF
jgi:hypothetical protein